MLRIDWYFILTPFGCLALAAAGLADSQSRHSKQQNYPVYSNGENNRSATSLLTQTPLPESAKYTIPCEHLNGNAESNLCAQWRAALASEKAAYEARRATNWSIVATILGFASFCGIIWSLMQTEGALGEARRGNRIAMKANARATRHAIAASDETAKALELSEAQVALSRAASHADLRAYLGINALKITAITATQLFGRVIIINDGRTPAKIKTVSVRAFTAHFPIIEINSDEFPMKKYYQFRALLNGSKTEEVIFSIMKPEDGDLTLFHKDQLNFSVYVYGRVDYIDAFQADQWCTFAYRVSGELNGVDTEFCPLVSGNDAS